MELLSSTFEVYIVIFSLLQVLKNTLQQYNKSRLTHKIEMHYLYQDKKKKQKTNEKIPKKPQIKPNYNTFYSFSLTHF